MFPDLMLHALDGLFAVDADQRVVFWNPACESITGIAADDAVGGRCHELLRGRDPKGRTLCRSDCPLGSLARGGPPPSKLCMRIDHPDGRRIQLSVGTMLIPSHLDDQWHVVHVLRQGREPRAASLFHHPAAGGIRRSRPQENCGLPAAPPAGAALLTSRERQVLRLMSEGHAAQAISDRLHIGVTTVRNHIQRLMAKLDVHTRLEAVTYALRHQLV